MLAEKLRRAREQCKQDERAIEEHQIKVVGRGYEEGMVLGAVPQ